MNRKQPTEEMVTTAGAEPELITLSSLIAEKDLVDADSIESLAARLGDEVVLDSVGRRCVASATAVRLVAERRERVARFVEDSTRRALEADARRIKVAASPAVEGASPFESLVAAAGVVTPSEEFGLGRVSPTQELLDAAFAEGRRSQAEAREKARLAQQMKDDLAKGER